MDIQDYLLCAAVLASIILSGVLTPYVLLVSLAKRKVDKLDGRKIHSTYTPRLGGLLFLPVLFVSAFPIWLFHLTSHASMVKSVWIESMSHLGFIVLALLISYFIGVADDLREMDYRVKFVGQFLVSILLVLAGLKISDLAGVADLYVLPTWVSVWLTIVVIMLVVNSINLIDGIDGLAAGLGGIALLYYGCFFFALQNFTYALMAFAMLGVVLSFFYYNVFGYKKRTIFMGDTGAISLGLLLAIFAIRLSTQLSQDTELPGNPLVFAFVPLLIPGLDLIRVFIHRLRTHKHPFKPDKNHIHHKMLVLGISQHETLGIILFLSFGYILSNVLMTKAEMPVNLILGVDIISYTLLNIRLTQKIKRQKNIIK